MSDIQWIKDSLERIEEKIDKINGLVRQHDREIVRIKTIGSIIGAFFTLTITSIIAFFKKW